ncbi:MAG: adenylyltransferase/cytidyltransferase family protein [Candidatus Diapherotrites archaeon]
MFRNIEVLAKKLDKVRPKKIVLTGGYFDLTHVGHLELLEFAKSQGDILVVNVGSDMLCKKVKGKKRPVLSENQRAKMVSSLKTVDFVFVSDEPTFSHHILHALKPNILVVNESWNGKKEIEDIEKAFPEIGIVFVEEKSAQDGLSTTQLIEKIKQEH